MAIRTNFTNTAPTNITFEATDAVGLQTTAATVTFTWVPGDLEHCSHSPSSDALDEQAGTITWTSRTLNEDFGVVLRCLRQVDSPITCAAVNDSNAADSDSDNETTSCEKRADGCP